MGRKRIPVYIGESGWVASSGAMTAAPLAGDRTADAASDWTRLADALRERFGTARVHLLLSARQCRFIVLPWLPACWSGASIRAYVADAFAEAEAITAETHHIEIDWPPYGEPILAAAYPRSVIQPLGVALRTAGHVLDSVDSSVGPIMRRYGTALGAGPALLAYADDGVVGITIERGRVVQVETPSGNSGLDTLQLWFARKQYAFADDNQLRWLQSTAMPEEFPGVPLPLAGVAPASPGHAVVASWR
jgi:hypothetical protein